MENLKKIVEQLQKQQLMKKDFIVPSSLMRMEKDAKLTLELVSEEEGMKVDDLLSAIGFVTSGGIKMTLDVLKTAHQHMSEKLGVPKTYYDRMLNEEHRPLLASNVNWWLDKSAANFMVRTFIDKDEKNGMVRAVLSDKYKPMDNIDVLFAALDALNEIGMQDKVDVLPSELTDTRMYVRFASKELTARSRELFARYIHNGRHDPTNMGDEDGIKSGFILSNSEIGFGSFRIQPRIVALVCNNGLVTERDALRKVHLGKQIDAGEIEWSQRTKQKEHELVMEQVKDAVRTYLSKEYVDGVIARFLEAQKKEVDDPIAAVRKMTTQLRYTEADQNEILKQFVKQGDLSNFGMAQAVTHYAHHQTDADKQYEMECAVGTVLEGNWN